MSTDDLIYIRRLTTRDERRVLAIDKASFKDQDLELPNTTRTGAVYFGYAAEYNNKLAGYCVGSMHKGVVYVDAIVVHPNQRRSGIGKAIMDKVKSLIGKGRTRSSIEVIVRDSDFGSLSFLKSMGFVVVQVLEVPFLNSLDDGYRMEFVKDKSTRFAIRNRIKT